MTDPRLIGLTPEARLAAIISNARKRVSVLERSPGGGGNGTVDTTPFVRKDTLTTKGDIFVATGAGLLTRLPVGSDGQVLTADSSTATGLAWATITTVPGFPTFTVTNWAPADRIYDANSTTISELADVMGAFLNDLPLPIGDYSGITNESADRTYDANSTTLDELADVLATVVNDVDAGGGPGGWNVTNETATYSYNADSVSLDTFADVLGTVINELISATLLTP